MQKIDEFLALKMVIILPFQSPEPAHHFIQVRDACVSFSMAKALHGWMEILPKVPEWKSRTVELKGYPMGELMHLFYHDTLNCIEYLFGNPLFANHMDFCLVR